MWKFTKADWPSFKALCETEVNNTILQADDPIDRFTTTLHHIAIMTIPKTSTKSKKKKNLGLMMIVKHLFRNENKLCDNLMLVLYTKIWKTFVFFVQKPAARFENQNVNPGNKMFPD